MQLLFVLAALAAATPQGTGLNPQSPQAVIKAEMEICRGYERNDVASVRRNLVDDYTLTDSRGVVTTKQDDVEDFTKHRVRYTTFRNKNMRVRLYPGVAIVTGQTVVKAIAGHAPVDVEVQFTDTLVLIDGRWMLAAGHVSRLRNAAVASTPARTPA